MVTKLELLAQRILLAKQAKESGTVNEFLRNVSMEKKKLAQDEMDKKAVFEKTAFSHLVRGRCLSQDEHERMDSSESTSKLSTVLEVASNTLQEALKEDAISLVLASEVTSDTDPEISDALTDSKCALDKQIKYPIMALASGENDAFLTAVSGVTPEQKQNGGNIDQSTPIDSPVFENKIKEDNESSTNDLLSTVQVKRYSDLARQMSERRGKAAIEKEINDPSSRKPRATVSDDPEWLHTTIPAGSNYSPQEWLSAQQSGDNHVFEVRNLGQSVLLRVPKRPEGVLTRTYPDKKSSNYVDAIVMPDPESLKGTLSPLFGTTWDGCMLLSPGAVTTHPGAVSGELVFKTGDKDMPEILYRIVRPETHRETLSWLYGLKGHFQAGAIGIQDSHEISPQPTPQDYSPGYEPDHDHPIERPRG